LLDIECAVKKRGMVRSGKSFGGSEEKGAMRKARNVR